MINKRNNMTIDFVINDGDDSKKPFEAHLIWRDAGYEHVLGLQNEFVGFLQKLNELGFETLDKQPTDEKITPNKPGK